MSIYENPNWPHFYWDQEKAHQALQLLLPQHNQPLGKMETYAEPLTEEHLVQWHKALFPTYTNGIIQRKPGVKQFLAWFNRPQSPIDLRIKAAVAHLWFMTLHPFEEGNQPIANKLTDILLARAENQPNRHYSLSTQIHRNQKAYEEMLTRTQKGTLDITPWILWFLETLHKAILRSESKAKFWELHLHKDLNKRQLAILNTLFDSTTNHITSSQWAEMTECSQDTASRDINHLINHNILIKSDRGGRSTSFLLKELSEL